MILENEMPGMRKEIPQEETYYKYGDASRKVEIGGGELWNTGLLKGPLSRKSRRVSLIEGRFAYTMENNPIAAGRQKRQELMLMKIEN